MSHLSYVSFGESQEALRFAFSLFHGTISRGPCFCRLRVAVAACGEGCSLLALQCGRSGRCCSGSAKITLVTDKNSFTLIVSNKIMFVHPISNFKTAGLQIPTLSSVM